MSAQAATRLRWRDLAKANLQGQEIQRRSLREPGLVLRGEIKRTHFSTERGMFTFELAWALALGKAGRWEVTQRTDLRIQSEGARLKPASEGYIQILVPGELEVLIMPRGERLDRQAIGL